jgi:hypothetical protein
MQAVFDLSGDFSYALQQASLKQTSPSCLQNEPPCTQSVPGISGEKRTSEKRPFVTCVTSAALSPWLESSVMLDSFLVPANTIVTAKGDSEALDISGAANRVFLLTLAIQHMIEQEGIDVLVYTSADGTTWDAKAIAGLEQKFYVGEYPLLIDLSEKPEAKFVRVHWEVYRWGRGGTGPQFEIGVRWREVSQEALREAAQVSP